MNIPLNIDWQQILLHLFNFAILFAILYFLLYKPVKDFMAKREEYYKNMDAEANDNLAASETAKAEYANKLAAADDEIRKRQEETRAAAEKAAAKRIEDARDEAAKIIARAKGEAVRERDRIIADAQTEISGMVTEATEKLVLESTASDAFDQFLMAVERGDRHDHDN